MTGQEDQGGNESRPDKRAKEGSGQPTDHQRDGWSALDAVDLKDEYLIRVRCLQAVPAFLHGPLRMAFVTSLTKLREGQERQDELGQERAWKLFRLTSRMLL